MRDALTGSRLHNLRPVGGVPGRSGRMLRADRIWRSAAPFAAADVVGEEIAALGVRSIVDLRDAAERARTPDAWRMPDVDVWSVPVFDDRLADLRFEHLAELYTLMTGEFAPHVARAFGRIARSTGHPVLLHCTAGKDRTGLISALILDVLGADRDTILADFALSQQRLGDAYLADLFADVDVARLPGLAAHQATACPPELMADAFATMEHDHGDAEGFLLAHGVSAAELTMLRTAMVA